MEDVLSFLEIENLDGERPFETAGKHASVTSLRGGVTC